MLDREPISMPSFVAELDPRLASVFQQLRIFTVTANRLCLSKEDKMEPDFFQEFMSSVQYRLIKMRGSMENVVSEAVRIGMLAFITTVHTQLPGFQLRYQYLATRLKLPPWSSLRSGCG
jgi:hypothetical protein